VFEAEQLILTTLNFELNVQHPYASLTSVLNKLGLSKTVMVNLALNLVSEGWVFIHFRLIFDGFSDDVCLYHSFFEDKTWLAKIKSVWNVLSCWLMSSSGIPFVGFD